MADADSVDTNGDKCCRNLRSSTRKRSYVKILPYSELEEQSGKTKEKTTVSVAVKSNAALTNKEESAGVKMLTIKMPRNLNTSFEPKNWRLVLDNIRLMRATRTAPVDVMGAEKCAEGISIPPEVKRFHVLISLMLSSQTKDHVTHAAMNNLKANGLSIDNIIKTNLDTLGKLIYPVSFWKTKAKNIIKVAVILNDNYGGDIPDTIEGLCSLPGVGPKMAHLCMNIAWGKLTGIGVDTHVHRISNRLGWVERPTKTPEQTRISLESWMPRELWSEVNLLLVGFGQQICTPRNPKCSECFNKTYCPYAQTQTK